MRTAAIIFALLPIVCLAQQENRVSTKANINACPTWENKKQPSKAEYFQSLRTNSGKSKEQQVAYLNKKEIPARTEFLRPAGNTKKQPTEKPIEQKAYIPAFSSGTDAVLEKIQIIKNEQASAERENDEIEKEEAANKAERTANIDRSKKRKRKVKTNCAGNNGVNTSKKSNTKCPAF